MMLIALAGVTGVGKSYYSQEIENNFNIKKIHTIRTRAIRPGEIDGITGYFMTEDELDNEIVRGNIAIDFSEFGGRYAYLKSEVFSNDNHVFEMHYTHIDGWKKVKPDMISIYILPRNIEIAINNIKSRNLSKEKEDERIKEVYEQYNNFMNNKELQEKFDYIVYNDFNDDSKNELLSLIGRIVKK